MSRSLTHTLLFLTVLLSTAALQAAGPFHGIWSSTYGTLKLVQQGNRVFGDYRNLGCLEGVYNPATRTLTGSFNNGGNLGVFSFQHNARGGFTGKWGWGTKYGTDAWNGSRTNGNVDNLAFKPTYWSGKWGDRASLDWDLTQTGSRVSGRYKRNGLIEGTVDQNTRTLSGTITLPRESPYRFKLTMAPDGLSATGYAFSSRGRSSVSVNRDARPYVSAAIAAAVQDEKEDRSLSGIAVGAIRDNRTVYNQGFGNYRGTTITAATVLPWASISKVLTAVTVHQLIEEGRMQLSDKIVDHVPYYVPKVGFISVPDAEKKKRITIEQLLSHTSGITHNKYHTSFAYSRDADGFDEKNAVLRFMVYGLLFDPGAKYDYSTSAYTLLGAAVEANGGFTKRVNRQICNRLGMTSLTISPTYGYKLPGGGYMGSIVDLTKLADGLLKGKLLRQTSRLYAGTYSGSSYHRGVIASGTPTQANFWFGHGGSQPGIKSELRVFPNSDDAVTVIIRDDNQNSSDRRAVANRVKRIIDNPYQAW